LELGLRGQIFEAPLILQELDTDSWMKHTWMTTCQADIHIFADIPDFPLNHHRDKELIQLFLQNGF